MIASERNTLKRYKAFSRLKGKWTNPQDEPRPKCQVIDARAGYEAEWPRVIRKNLRMGPNDQWTWVAMVGYVTAGRRLFDLWEISGGRRDAPEAWLLAEIRQAAEQMRLERVDVYGWFRPAGGER